MIISASYRTDIPAFYGDWFMARLEAGFCETVNPYGGQHHRVQLDRETVSGIVFWTKNLAPFFSHLPELDRRGYPFVVQYTINRYPRALETSVVDWERAAGDVRRLAADFGPRRAVWRYDPVVTTSLTPAAWHIDNFTRIADRLAGSTDEVTVSFAHIYRKTRHNLDTAARARDFAWRDPPDDEKRGLLGRLAGIAAARKMRLTVCSQPGLLVAGTASARCIDADRMAAVAARPITARLKGNRPDCGCHESRDIGAYDSCPHGCVYCYAVRSRDAARRRHDRHSISGTFLVPPTPASAA